MFKRYFVPPSPVVARLNGARLGRERAAVEGREPAVRRRRAVRDRSLRRWRGGTASHFDSPPLWGLRTWVSCQLGAGTALIGSAQEAAHTWRRGDIRVELSNSPEDFFRRNLNAVRAEERLAFGILRPASWVVVSGLN